MKKILLLLVAFLGLLGLTACETNNSGNNNNPGGNPGENPGGNPGENPGGNPGENPGEVDPYEIKFPVTDDFTANAGAFSADYQAYLLVDLYDVATSVGTLKSEDLKKSLFDEYNKGLDAIKAAKTNKAAAEAFAAAKAAIINVLPKANGVFNYVDKTYAEKAEITGALEAYAVRNGLTGISLFENGGYVLYHDRITLGTENYITGFGFGTLAHGDITADLDTEAKAEWKRYYHDYSAEDPGTANALNGQDSIVSSFYGPMAASFFTTFMNETKDGYDWVPELAKAKPTPVLAEGEEATGMHTTWRFPVRVGDELKYTTLSKVESRAAFNGRAVEAEDYLTPFKVLLDQSNGYFRGSEMAGNKSGSAIVGAKEYYDATKNGVNDAALAAWENVGLKVYEEGGETWFQVEYAEPTNAYYAMYYTSSFYAPFPMEFFELVGKEAFLGFDKDQTTTPVDNSLSVGAYVIEAWETNKVVAYKKNPNYVYADEYYKIPGVKTAILTALNTDPNAAFKEFLDGKLDSSGIPQEYFAEYRNDPRARTTSGDSNFKLNVNATDAATWEYFFGVNGVIGQNQPSDYWQVEPALSNPHFVKALSLSIDRVTYSSSRGSIPSVDYLSSNYMADPERGIAYSTTAAHKAAVAGLLRDTDGYGFDLEMAREYFKVALEELVHDGKYVAGTADAPTVIELEIAWMRTSHETQYHNEIKQFLESAFNHDSVSGGKFKLDVKFWVGAEAMAVYEEKLQVGKFDLGFGAISGNPLNPLDFLGVLSANQDISGGFTLNWGTDTNNATKDVLVYDGMQWSYDALWTAGNGTAVVVDGQLVPVHKGTSLVNSTANEDGSVTLEIKSDFNVSDAYHGEVTKVVLYTYMDIAQDMAGTGNTYTEVNLTELATITANEDGSYTVVVTVSKENIDLLKLTHALAYGNGYSGIDIYFNEVINGVPNPSYASIVGEEFIAEPAA